MLLMKFQSSEIEEGMALCLVAHTAHPQGRPWLIFRSFTGFVFLQVLRCIHLTEYCRRCHLIAPFIAPMQFTTHLILMSTEAIWITNIHDCIDGTLWPVMGAGYHTIHHTSYKHNDGHYIFMDWVFGILCEPKSQAQQPRSRFDMFFVF